MKNVLLLLGLLLFSLSLMADYPILQENFEGGVLPSGWSNFSMTGSAWAVNSPGYNSSYKLHIANSTPSSIDMVVVSTPAINISGLNGAPLVIDYMLYQDIDLDTADLGMFQPQYSYDGSNWSAITEEMSEVVDTWHQQQHVFFPEAQSQIYIGFLCYMMNNTGALLEFGIDDFQVSAGAPELSLNTTSLDFGTIFVGDYAIDSFTVTNTGSLSLEYSFTAPTYFYMEIDGLVYATYTGTLESGMLKEIDIYFHPIEATAYTGDPHLLTSNDPNNPTTNITISASSVYPGTGANVIGFDGTLDWGKSFMPLSLSANSAVTIETWFRVDGSNTIQFLTSSGNEKLEIHLNMTHNSLRFIPTTGVYLDTDDNAISPGSWTHLACVYNSNSGTGRIYINGAEMNVTNNGYNSLNTPIPTTLSQTHMGIRADFAYRFNGAMDEIRFWNSERTTEQIRNNKHLQLELPQTDLLAYWRCDETESKFIYNAIDGNYIEMYNYDASQRIATDFAFGTGVAECLTVPTGSGVVSGSTTGVSLNVSSGNGQVFSVTRLNSAPLNPPTGQYTVFDDQTWVIQTFGSDQMTCDITYTLSEDLTQEDEWDMDNIRSNGRPAKGSGNFTNYVGAIDVDADTDQATYGGLTAVPTPQQMILTRQSVPSFPQLYLSATAFDFGNNFVGEVVSQQLSVANVGNEPLTYEFSVTTPFYLDIDGSHVQTCSGTLPNNGDTDNINVVFAPAETCAWTGETFSFSSNDPGVPSVNMSFTASAVMPATGVKSVQFNGTNDYAETFQPIALPANSAMTLEMWFNAYSGGESIQFLTSSSMEVLEAHLNLNDHSLTFIPTLGVYLKTPENSFTPNTWTHLAFVYDPANSYVKLYINGVDTPFTQSGYNPISTPIQTPLGNTRFGKRSDNTFPFFGALDEIRIWTSARSEDDIRNNKHMTLSLPRPDMLAYWRCNETEGSALLEEVNRRHAQLQYYNAGARINTGFAIGDGFSVIYTAPVGGGTLDCVSSSVFFDFTVSDGQDIVITYLYGSPINPPTGCHTVFNDNTRIIQTFGSTDMAGEITFAAFGDMTTDDQILHDNIRLNGRNANSVDNFNNLTGATEVNPGTDRATFPLTSALPNSQQFIITRQNDTIYPVIDLNTHTLDFGMAFIGSNSDAWLQITNTGDANLDWTINSEAPITITDGAGNDVFEYSASCTPGFTYGVLLKFHPTELGSQSGSFEIISNDPTQGAQTVEWSGTGTNLENGEYAMHFSGVNQYINVPAESDFCGPAYTIETWFMRPEFTTMPQFLCGRGTELFEIHLSGNSIRFIPARSVYLDSPTNVFVDGEWTHIACTYDPYNGTAAMYINGNEVPLINHGTNPLTTFPPYSDFPFVIGCRSYQQYFFNGCLDEFRVWNCVRTADEIRLGMHEQPASDTQDLKNYWRFNHGEGDTVYNLAGQYNGTIYGATWDDSPLILGEDITYMYQAPTEAGTLDCPEVDMSFEFATVTSGSFYITLCPGPEYRNQRYDSVFDNPTRIIHYYGNTTPEVTMTVGIVGFFTDMDEYDPTNIRLVTRTDGNFGEYALGQGANHVDFEAGEAVYVNPLDGVNGTQFYLVREGEPELGKPREVRLTVAEGIVEIIWDAVPGATWYRVETSSSPDGEFVIAPNGETTETEWSIPVTEGEAFYRITTISD